MSEEIVFPVAETFYSIQGEATYTGTPMFFIRLAGCNVGKTPKLSSDFSGDIPFQIIHPEHTTCTALSGTQFVCDTDYRVKERLTIEQLLNLIPPGVKHVSITGGEPLIHKHLPELIKAIDTLGIMVHVETSGTIDLCHVYRSVIELWITCSPKSGFLDINRKYINEYKFLVETAEDLKLILPFQSSDSQIWVQPIEHYDANGPIKSSYDLVVNVAKTFPNWRVSIQTHKILGVR